VAENGILHDQIKGRLHLSDADRRTLAEIGKKLGKQVLEEIAKVAKPDTILGWHRKLVAEKFDGSEQRKALGRPRVDKELEGLVVQMAKEKRSSNLAAMIKDLPPHAEVEITFEQYEDAGAHIYVYLPPDMAADEVDRLEVAVGECCNKMLLDTGLFIISAVCD
jgi:hypothetical protein